MFCFLVLKDRKGIKQFKILPKVLWDSEGGGRKGLRSKKKNLCWGTYTCRLSKEKEPTTNCICMFLIPTMWRIGRSYYPHFWTGNKSYDKIRHLPYVTHLVNCDTRGQTLLSDFKTTAYFSVTQIPASPFL